MPLRANAVEVNGTSFPQVKPRPGMRRMPTNATRYMEMLLELDSVPAWHNMAVAIAAWMLLASFMILPGTFATIQEIDAENGGFTDIEQWVLSRVRNLPLLVVAGVCCGLGALGMMAFWLRWRNNYVWICNRVFLPGVLNALAGLLSTLINVYTAQEKQWSITAKVSAIVEACCLAVCGSLFLVYSNWMLEKVKRRHDKQIGVEYPDYGFADTLSRNAKRPLPAAA